MNDNMNKNDNINSDMVKYEQIPAEASWPLTVYDKDGNPVEVNVDVTVDVKDTSDEKEGN